MLPPTGPDSIKTIANDQTTIIEQVYFDYGPLMNKLKEKQWVLKSGIVRVKDDKAKVNIFKTKAGYSIPVVYGDGDVITIILNDAVFRNGNTKYKAYLPGHTKPVSLKVKRNGALTEINVPLIRGAAMVTVSK